MECDPDCRTERLSTKDKPLDTSCQHCFEQRERVQALFRKNCSGAFIDSPASIKAAKCMTTHQSLARRETVQETAVGDVATTNSAPPARPVDDPRLRLSNTTTWVPASTSCPTTTSQCIRSAGDQHFHCFLNPMAFIK